MKPIEEGCTAIVVGPPESPNTGKIVKVLRFIGKEPNSTNSHGIVVCGYDDVWEVDQEMAWQTTSGVLSLKNRMTEKRLQRLDDTDENELVKNEIEERV